jgi:hypothetical protein
MSNKSRPEMAIMPGYDGVSPLLESIYANLLIKKTPWHRMVVHFTKSRRSTCLTIDVNGTDEEKIQ